MKLDTSTMAILDELQRDGKISYSQLSNATGLPTSTLHDRIKNLLSDGVIQRYTVQLDGEKLGFNHIGIIGVETGARKYKQVASTLCELDHVLEVYGTTGEFDLMVKVVTQSREDLSLILNEIRQVDGVDDIVVSYVLEVFKVERRLPLRRTMDETTEESSNHNKS